MKHKKAYLQRLIYQMGDLCNDPDQFNDDAYNELLHTVASIDVLALLRPLEKLLQSYERTEDRYFCYLLQRHILLNGKKYIQLAALQYQRHPEVQQLYHSYTHERSHLLTDLQLELLLTLRPEFETYSPN